MDDEQILALLSSIEPSEGEIPKPPSMTAIPATPVLEAGADVDIIDGWVKAHGGWTHRAPAHLAGPGGERPPEFFIVPRGHLRARSGEGVPFLPTEHGGAAPRPFVPDPDPGGGPGAAAAGVPGPAPASVPGAGDVPGAGNPPGAVPSGEDLPAVVPGVASAPSVGSAQDADSAAGLAKADLLAFVSTADLAAARAFYSRRLGLHVLGQSPIDCTFDAGGTKLRVATVDDLVVAPYTVLGWTVTDIKATIVELAARGVEFEIFEDLEQDKFGVWNSPGGALVAWFRDPDGNLLSLTQP